MKKDISTALLAIVRDIIPSKSLSDQALLDVAYLDEGYIDSFQLVELIVTLENSFTMKFSAEDLTSKDFRTFSGVARIIEKNQ